MQFSNTVTIDRSPTEVFAFLTHFENLPLWNYAIRETRRVGTGPEGVGARYRQTRTIPRTTVETFEVTDLEPNRIVTIQGTLGPFEAVSRYELKVAGDGTVLTNTMQIEPSGGRRLITSLVIPQVRAAVAGNLNTLKSILEHRTAPSTA